ARDHLQDVEVIGLGTQDSLGQAQDFVEDYGTESFTMLWDQSFLSWQALGVTSQPAAVMFAADGTPITGWIGAFPEDEVLRLAAESQAT
ncbi:TlpA family protein disulfide reductase, partial [uncultured Ilumatobacter sp.]|uniref:TlpA family protein disulfide reductase n=1 Tax=uncultured Ilumatobacter sp. TaxID=879968 RepID=UPI00374EC29A